MEELIECYRQYIYAGISIINAILSERIYMRLYLMSIGVILRCIAMYDYDADPLAPEREFHFKPFHIGKQNFATNKDVTVTGVGYRFRQLYVFCETLDSDDEQFYVIFKDNKIVSNYYINEVESIEVERTFTDPLVLFHIAVRCTLACDKHLKE